MIRFALRALAWTVLLILAVSGGISLIASGIAGRDEGVSLMPLGAGVAALVASYGLYWWLKRDERPKHLAPGHAAMQEVSPLANVADDLTEGDISGALVVVPVLVAALVYIGLLVALMFLFIGLDAVLGLDAQDGGVGQMAAAIEFGIALIAPAVLIVAGYRRAIRFVRERYPGLADFIGIGRRD